MRTGRGGVSNGVWRRGLTIGCFVYVLYESPERTSMSNPAAVQGRPQVSTLLHCMSLMKINLGKDGVSAVGCSPQKPSSVILAPANQLLPILGKCRLSRRRTSQF